MSVSPNNTPKMIRTCIYMPQRLHTKLKTICLITNRSMGEVMRAGIREKIASIKIESNVNFNEVD